MKLDKSDIIKIQNRFAEMQTKKDLLDLLNYTSKILYGAKFKPYVLEALTICANPNLCQKKRIKRYNTFTIKKKSGKERIINAPVGGLRMILRTLNVALQCVYEPHKAATGFVKGKSIVDNAKVHINQTYVYNIDLKDFFHSFNRNRVKMAFMQKPFNLKGERPITFRTETIDGNSFTIINIIENNPFEDTKKRTLEYLAFLLASLCTHPFKIEGKTQIVLPQGSPTSPTITNIICSKLDRRLSGLAKRFGAKYTRYADDITFSSMVNVFKKEEFLKELHRIIKEDNLLKFDDKTITLGPELKINSAKTRLQKNVYRQEVTGLVVNEKVNVPRRYVKQLRRWIYYWEKYGLNIAEQKFKKTYIRDKGYVKKGNSNFANVLDGKLEYLKMVKGEKDSTYLSLKKRFDKLQGNVNPNLTDDILETRKGELMSGHELSDITSEIDSKSILIEEISRCEGIAPKQRERLMCLLNEEIGEKEGEKNSEKQHPKPKETYEFLKLFSGVDGGMKNLTHTFNGGKYIEYDKFINQCRKEFNDAKNKYPNVPNSLIRRIEEFAFKEDPNWFLGKENEKRKYYKEGWSEPNFIEWYRNNKKHPALDAKYNKEMIIPFKESIQVRSDLGNLLRLIEEKKIAVFGETPSVKISVNENVNKAQFYTNVDELGNAIFNILTTIKEFSEKNFCDEVEINYVQENDFKVLSITHVDSKPMKSVKDKDFIGGNIKDIRNNLWGLCNYEICADFPEGKYRKVILTDNKKELDKNKKIESDTIKGFTHKLKFY